MTAFNKQYKTLCNQYNKKLLADHKANFSTLNNNLDYFITYLKYLRDYYLLTDTTTQLEDTVNMKTATLVAAVSEYEKYISCISNYYKLNGNIIEKKTDEPDEEVTKKYNLEKKFH
jgi:hypothetical protein